MLALTLALAAPARAEEGAARVVLRWQAVPGASGYDLQLAADPEFTRRELEVRVALAGYRLGSLPETRRYWRVRSVDADGRPGPWSSTKTVEPLVHAPQPIVEPEPPLLDVPALAPEAVDAPAPLETGLSPTAPVVVGALAAPSELSVVPEASLAGLSTLGVLRDGRFGVLVGWRHNLLAVDSPVVTLEGAWPLPWFGAGWGTSLRVGWWRDRSELPFGPFTTETIAASADVFPLAVLVTHSFPLPWARLYAGVGGGADLVVVRVDQRGALEAGGALDAVLGAGRPIWKGELFCELQGGLGGVSGPLGRLRTGGVSLSVGYHPWR